MTAQCGPAPCSVCGVERTIHQAARGAICGQPTCRRTLVIQRKAAEKQAFDTACDAIVAKTGKRPDVMVPVPFYDRKVIETPEATKRAFRETLRKEIRDAVAANARGSVIPTYEEPEASSLSLNASCIACRGRCCRLGGAHAFLDLENMQDLLAKRPDDSPAAIYRDYVRRIPEQSMDQSCLYQGERGCALPAAMRSNVCHSFECDERVALKEALGEREDASALVVAMEGETVKAAVIAAPDGGLEWVET